MTDTPHRKLERSATGFMLAIVAAASVGGLVEIAPLFTIDETVENVKDMRLYTPLELAGRDIYVREGCYACHSQMIRTLRETSPYSAMRIVVLSELDQHTVASMGLPDDIPVLQKPIALPQLERVVRKMLS